MENTEKIITIEENELRFLFSKQVDTNKHNIKIECLESEKLFELLRVDKIDLILTELFWNFVNDKYENRNILGFEHISNLFPNSIYKKFTVHI